MANLKRVRFTSAEYEIQGMFDIGAAEFESKKNYPSVIEHFQKIENELIAKQTEDGKLSHYSQEQLIKARVMIARCRVQMALKSNNEPAIGNALESTRVALAEADDFKKNCKESDHAEELEHAEEPNYAGELEHAEEPNYAEELEHAELSKLIEFAKKDRGSVFELLSQHEAGVFAGDYSDVIHYFQETANGLIERSKVSQKEYGHLIKAHLMIARCCAHMALESNDEPAIRNALEWTSVALAEADSYSNHPELSKLIEFVKKDRESLFALPPQRKPGVGSETLFGQPALSQPDPSKTMSNMRTLHQLHAANPDELMVVTHTTEMDADGVPVSDAPDKAAKASGQ